MKKILPLLLEIILLTGCTKDDKPEVARIPSVATNDSSVITTTSATSGGVITDDGGTSILEKGVCWSTSANPTIALATKTTDGAGSGFYASNISGLTANTTYYVRAYATNSAGTAYGDVKSFLTTISITEITSVRIGTQIWTDKNLDVSTYRDGTPIVQGDLKDLLWINTGAWYYYYNDPANGATYGKLYNWKAVMGVHDTDPSTPNKILAPTGWHIPTREEWETLRNYLGGSVYASNAGGKMKSTLLWFSPNTGANNSSGFTALPYGPQNPFNGFWWSTSAYSPYDNNVSLRESAWACELNHNNGGMNINKTAMVNAYAVRCIKD